MRYLPRLRGLRTIRYRRTCRWYTRKYSVLVFGLTTRKRVAGTLAVVPQRITVADGMAGFRRGLNCRIGSFEITFDLHRRNVQGTAHLVETVDRSVLGQVIRQVEIDAQQFVDGVLIFDPIQATRSAPWSTHRRLAGCCGQLLTQVILQHQCRLPGIRPRPIFRRHLAWLKPLLKHFEPQRTVAFRITHVHRQRITQVRFLLLGAMTLDAMPHQKLPSVIR